VLPGPSGSTSVSWAEALLASNLAFFSQKANLGRNYGDPNDRLYRTQVTVSIGRNRKSCLWHYDGAAIPETSVAALRERFAQFALRAFFAP
jgi:hypothetical protein